MKNNNDQYDNLMDVVAKSSAAGIEIAKKSISEAQNLRRMVLNAISPEEEITNVEDIIGSWYYDGVEVTAIDLSTIDFKNILNDVDGYYLELLPDGKANICMGGINYETTYDLTDGCISFAHAELATMKLTMHDGRLRMSGSFGSTIYFKKRND